MNEVTSARIRFGAFELDLKASELYKNGRRIRLQEQPLQVLQMLVERAGEVVSRDEIQSKLWPNDTIVEFDHGINTAIRKLRNALNDSAENPSYIETIARRGYRFIMPVEWRHSSSDAAARGATPVSSDSSGTAVQPQLRSSDLSPGKTVSHYRVLNIIGGGGMGVVYRAEDLNLGRIVALKFLPEEVSSDPIALERFKREARTASSLNHPHICTIYGIEEHEGRPFIEMEYLEGQTLRDLIMQASIGLPLDKARKPPLAVQEVVDIALQIADGLDAAHQRGIIHRDIKPANIFITRQRQVKILDFGLAKLITTAREGASDRLMVNGRDHAAPSRAETEPEANLTRAGAYLGTTGYMSPEQVQGLKLDARTDLFCFGLVLYELTTGKRAFDAASKESFRDAVLNQSPVPVHELNPLAPQKLEEIIDRCLQKDRGQRYQHASDVTAELKQVLAQSITQDEKKRGKSQAEKPAPRSKPWVVAAAIVAVAVVVGLFFAYRYHAPTVVGPSAASIAVLPFVDANAGKDDGYFSDGLTEQLISDLARIPGLKVVAHSSVTIIKEKKLDPISIGRQLNVANLLEGSVRREGDRVRITAELTKADDGFQLWSQTYDRRIGDIFAIQDEIARAVAAELQVKLTGANGAPFTTKAATTTPEAYQAYLQGRYFSRRHEPGDYEKALTYDDEAIRLDPKYAPSWSLRSYVLGSLALRGAIDNEEGFRKARESAQAAIGLDPTLADAYLALGKIQVYHDFDFAAAEVNLSKAAELEPGNIEVYLARATIGRIHGKLDDAIEAEKKAMTLDPLRGHGTLAFTLYNAARYEEALAAYQKALEVSPQSGGTHFYRGAILLAQNHPDQALAEMQQEVWDDSRLLGEAMVFHTAGRNQESDNAVNELIAKHQRDSPYQVAQAYAYRNEADKAFLWLDRAYRQRDGAILNLKIDPLLKSLRQDPRYAEILNKMRL